MPELTTQLEIKTMETKYGFTFTETQLEEEFRFQYTTDSEHEDVDDSFVPVRDNTTPHGVTFFFFDVSSSQTREHSNVLIMIAAVVLYPRCGRK